MYVDINISISTMKHLKNKLDNLLYGYDPKAYMPIRVNGKLRNKRQYLSYKAKALLNR